MLTLYKTKLYNHTRAQRVHGRRKPQHADPQRRLYPNHYMKPRLLQLDLAPMLSYSTSVPPANFTASDNRAGLASPFLTDSLNHVNMNNYTLLSDVALILTEREIP